MPLLLTITLDASAVIRRAAGSAVWLRLLLFLALLGSGSLSQPLPAQQTQPSEASKAKVATLTTTFQTDLDQTLATTSNPALDDLDTKYLAAVERGFSAATRAGNLDEALLWRDEKARIKNAQRLPATDPDTLPSALLALRQTYREAAARFPATDYAAAAALFDQLDADLDALQIELTRNIALDDALFVKAERDRFAKLRTDTIPTDTPIETKLTVHGKAPKLPQWLEKAAESGGSLRLWGIINKQAIEERTALKDFSQSDYVRVATGRDAFILGVRRRGNGQRTLLNKEAQGNHAVVEFREIQYLDRQFDSWLADDTAFKSNGHSIAKDLKLDEKPLIHGGGDSHLLRLASGEWKARGYAWNKSDKTQPAFQLHLAALQKDETTVLSANMGSVTWVTKDNRLRRIRIDINSGAITEYAIKSQPSEPIVDLLAGSGKTYGNWVALGKSGAVYAQATGGFSSPVAELSPAIAIRGAGEENLNTIAARRPDGTWHAVGPNEEINRIISQAGPALDLDFHIGSKTKTVLWIEPKSSIKP